MAAIGVGVEGAIGAVQLASAAGRAALEYRRRTHKSPQQVAYEPRLGRGGFTIRCRVRSLPGGDLLSACLMMCSMGTPLARYAAGETR